MGSSGTGSFSDYSNYKPSSDNKNGGSSGEDQCKRAFSSELEEVERCDYYQAYGIPGLNTPIKVEFRTRLIVSTLDNDILIGYLPTRYNYLAKCMRAGFIYNGTISSTSEDPIVSIDADIAPINNI